MTYIEHEDLINLLNTSNQIPIYERRALAKKRRKNQIIFWRLKDREWDLTHKRKSSKPKIVFSDEVLFLEASSKSDYNEMKKLLDKGSNPDTKNYDGLTPLHQACIDGSDSILALLIKYGADVNAQDKELWTPLHAAVACNQKKLVKILVAKGADLLALNIDGYMPVDLCEEEDMFRLVNTEMERMKITQHKIDFARKKVEKQMLADLKSLHVTGGDLEYRDDVGATPLHIAAANGYLSVCDFLLCHDVNVNVLDKDDWTPAHAAAYWEHIEVLQLLLNYGADFNIKNKNMETPIDICEEPEFREDILKLKKRNVTSDPVSMSYNQERLGRVSKTKSVNSKAASINRIALKGRESLSKRDTESERQIILASEILDKIKKQEDKNE